MIRPVVIAAVLALGASHAAAQAPAVPKSSSVPAPILTALKAAGGKVLKDPYSAKWEGLRHAVRPNVRGEPTEVVCGYVNAKNAYGAYAGAKPFVYFVARNNLNLSSADPVDQITVPAMLKTFCTGLI